MNHKLLRNIKVDYIFCFLSNIDLSNAVWVLYLLYKGIPLWQIGLLEGIFHMVSFLSEVPSGALADLFGRKKVMLMGRICRAIASILMIFSQGFFGFSVSFLFSAWGYNLNSGAEEALVYDSMKLCKIEKDYIKVNGRLNIILEVSQGLSTFLGGILSEYSYLTCYILATVAAILSIIPVLFLKEPGIPGKNGFTVNSTTLVIHFKHSLNILKANRELQKILLFYPITFTFHTVVFFYGQKYFSDFGLNKIQISIIMLLAGTVSCFGALCSEFLLKLLKEKTIYIAAICMGTSILGMNGNSLAFSILMFSAGNFANALLYPIESFSINQLIPSEQRATIISVNSMIFSLIMILIFPIAGFGAEILGLGRTFFLLGILQLLFTGLLIRRKKEKQDFTTHIN